MTGRNARGGVSTLKGLFSGVAVSVLLALGAGCAPNVANAEPQVVEPVATGTLVVQANTQGLKGAERVEYILSRMTVEEKLGQLNQMAGGRQIALNSRITDAEYDRVRRGGVGSYLHVAGAEFLGGLQRVAVEESRTGIPLLFAMDVVHGYRTIFPVPLGVAASFDPDMAAIMARVSAVEATGAGLHWTFAPMVDVSRDPRWGRVVEGAGEEPFFGASMARAQVQGYQGGGLERSDTLLATAKHFGAYGAATGGRDYDSADISQRTLMEVYLPPFYAAAEEGSGSFMVAFNDIGGVPTTGNRALVYELLREDWGYQGLVVSDWNSVLELMNHGVAATRTDAGRLALLASVDMEMMSEIYATDMTGAVEADPELQAALDDSVRRVLMAKDRLGLFDDPYVYHDPAREVAVMLTPEHRLAARTVAEKSMVLLRNDEGLLPLAEAPGKVVVIGALADDARSMIGSWKAQGRPEDAITVRAELEARLGAENVTYVAGGGTRDEVDLEAIKAAVDAAETADVVVLVIGEDYNLSAEARSRSNISLPASQAALAKAVLEKGKPTVVVLMNGRPLDLSAIEGRASTVLEAWFPGIEAGPAVVRTLFGDVSPAGRLPISFPRTTGASPWSIGHYPTGRPADPDPSKDTARYMDLPITPAYAFGYGLSYASFDYGNLEVSNDTLSPGETITISVDVTNTSDVQSDEVVQLYVRDPAARVARPMQELRGFARLGIAPGATRTVSFTLKPEQFSYFAPSGQFEADAGVIEFSVGASSDDIRLTGSFELTEAVVSDAPAAAIETIVTIEGE